MPRDLASGRVCRALRRVLLRIYASCLEGQDEIAKRRIFEALA